MAWGNESSSSGRNSSQSLSVTLDIHDSVNALLLTVFCSFQGSSFVGYWCWWPLWVTDRLIAEKTDCHLFISHITSILLFINGQCATVTQIMCIVRWNMKNVLNNRNFDFVCFFQTKSNHIFDLFISKLLISQIFKIYTVKILNFKFKQYVSKRKKKTFHSIKLRFHNLTIFSQLLSLSIVFF